MPGFWWYELLKCPIYPKLVWVEFLSLKTKEFVMDVTQAKLCLGHQHWPWNREGPRTQSSFAEQISKGSHTHALCPCFSSPCLWVSISTRKTLPSELLMWASLMAWRLKCLPGMWETLVWSLSWEDPLEKEMATHSSTLAWRIPWKEEPGRLQSIGLQRVGHNWATSLSFFLSLWNDRYTTISTFEHILCSRHHFTCCYFI